jgi:hypothetical protein
MLYASNIFAMHSSTIETLPLLLPISHFDTITSIAIVWNASYWVYPYKPFPTSLTKSDNEEWDAMWKVIAKMKGLQNLQVTISRSGRFWEALSKEEATEIMRPIMAVTGPVSFELDLPFDCPSQEAPWVDLPCKIQRTSSEYS